jgi:GNAT superfamily N-acetyltransferase
MNVELKSAQAARALFSASKIADQFAHADDALTLVLTRDDTASGVLQLQTLAFDSELFGVSSARINVFSAETEADYAALLAACRSECRSRGVRHVVRRLPVGQFAETWGLGSAGYRLVDVSVLFERVAGAPSASDPSIRVVAPAEAEQLAIRYADAFTLTRFAVDPFVSAAAATELHRRWILNSCRGRADVVLVADLGGKLAGFVTCRVDKATAVGIIELMAVDAARRGAGIGRRLVAGAIAWFSGRVERIHVRTQLNNAVAIGLYQASGFQLLLGELTYSWLDQTEDSR